MYKTYVLSIILIFVITIIGFSQETVSAIKVDEIALCTSVEERQPVGVDTAFVKTVEQLYCFVKVSGESDTTSIYHAWFYNDKEMAKVELAVKGKTWRTWSSKRITEDWVGKWKVEVSTTTGDVLLTKEFVIK